MYASLLIDVFVATKYLWYPLPGIRGACPQIPLLCEPDRFGWASIGLHCAARVTFRGLEPVNQVSKPVKISPNSKH